MRPWDLKKASPNQKMPQSGVGSMQGSSKGHLLLKVIIRCRSSFTTGRLPLKVIFHRRSSSTEGCLPLKVVFHQRSPSTKDYFPPKVVFLLKVVFKWRLYSTNGRLPPKVVFHWMLSSTEGPLPPTKTPYICESSQHTKSQPPTLLWCVLNIFWTKQTNKTNAQKHILRQHSD